jgi:membrane-associated protease RseP (regulator of RpoE activity)
VISAGTLFFTFFYEQHVLKIAVVPVLSGAFAGMTDSPFSMSPVLINSGNRTETVLAVYLEVNQVSVLPYKGPFVLKAGDALATTVDLDLKEVSRSAGCVVTKQQYEDRGSYNCHVSLVVSGLDPGGWQMVNKIALANFKVSDDLKKYTYLSTSLASSTYKISSSVSDSPQTFTIFNDWSILRPGRS